jgi:hypothetical protein
VEWSAPSETKDETTNNRLRAMDVGALTTLGTVAPTDRQTRMVINLDQLATYVGGARDERP